MTGVRLTIVTTRPGRAMRQVFGADMAVPSWIRVVSDPADCPSIPDGMRCLGIFYEPRGAESPLEQAWQRRRRLGGISGMTGGDLGKLKAWAEKRGFPVAGKSCEVPADSLAGETCASPCGLNVRSPDTPRALSGGSITAVRHLEAGHG